MTHRHYGIPVAKPRPTYSAPSRAAAWRGGAIGRHHNERDRAGFRRLRGEQDCRAR
jgi:hypothetical protein